MSEAIFMKSLGTLVLRMVVRKLAFHLCDKGLDPGGNTLYGPLLPLVVVLSPRGFYPGSPFFPSPQNQHF